MEKPCDFCLIQEKLKVYDEKYDSLKQSIDKLELHVKDVVDKMNERIDEVNKKTDNLDNALSNRLTQIETKFDIYNDLTCKKLDGLEKKIDDLLIVKNESVKSKTALESQDSFKEWLTKIGMKLLEFAIYGGMLYAVVKNIKLF